MKENSVCPVIITARLHDTFLLANYPSGAVDIGEGIVKILYSSERSKDRMIARDVEHKFRALIFSHQ